MADRPTDLVNIPGTSDRQRLPHADAIDGYVPTPNDPAADAPDRLPYGNMDGYANALTGFGTPGADKTMGGQPNGPPFTVRLFTGVECENRWRGSDLGASIVEQIPNEMTREGWELSIQPAPADAEPKRDAATSWYQQRVEGFSRRQRRIMGRWDVGAAAPIVAPGTEGSAPSAPAASTLSLPASYSPNDETQAQVQAFEAKHRELGTKAAFALALMYVRAYGGAAILLGVDDGDRPLTEPLDETRVKSLQHLTVFRGGWDGELVAWNRYYRDPRRPRFGDPEMWQLRNLGVPIAATPAPGEVLPPELQRLPQGPAGSTIFYVHDSRFLIFPGLAVSRRVKVQNRGWGDSVFTRVDEVLSQFGQTWNAVAVLMQEWAQGVLKVKDLARLMNSKDPAAQGAILQRLQMLQMSMSLCRVRLLDEAEEFKREVAPLTGIGDVLEQMTNRLAAAAGMPVALLMGQRTGLNAQGDADTRFFYDKIAGTQDLDLLPHIYRLQRLMMLAKDSPTRGREPARWSVEMRPLWQPTELEQADLRNKQADTDVKYITAGVVSPEEVAASRYGGSKYSTDTVLDIEGRQAMAQAGPSPPTALPAPSPGAPSPTPPTEGPPKVGGAEGEEAAPDLAHPQNKTTIAAKPGGGGVVGGGP